MFGYMFPKLGSYLANDGGSHPNPDGPPGPGDTTQDPGVPGPGNPPLPPGPTTLPLTPPDGGEDWHPSGGLPPEPSPPGPNTPPPPLPPPTQAPRNAADFALPHTGLRPQDSGGRGNPYVGTGWNNLSNFLNQTNLNYGRDRGDKEAPPMDLSRGRQQNSVDFDNWMTGQNYEKIGETIASPNGPNPGGGETSGGNNPGPGGHHLPPQGTQPNFRRLNNYLNAW